MASGMLPQIRGDADMIVTRRKLDLPILRVPDWPACDQAAWHEATRPVGWLDEGGRLSKYPAASIQAFESAYGRWLGFLSTQFHMANLRSGLDNLDRESLRAFVERLSSKLAPITVHNYLISHLTVARALAPERVFPFLRTAIAHLKRTAKPISDKRSRIVPIRDLYALGRRLMEIAPASPTPLKGAGLYRDGLMIALLAVRPIRIGNLSSIEIDRHLLREGDAFWLVFPAAEVKNRRPLEFTLPTNLTEPISEYLDLYRPRLLSRRGRHWRRCPGKALWISEHGTALGRSHIREHICRRTRERFGFSVNPHLFRDCAATSIATADPAHVGIIMPILGHARADTAERYYNQASSLDAARRYQDTIGTLRGD